MLAKPFLFLMELLSSESFFPPHEDLIAVSMKDESHFVINGESFYEMKSKKDIFFAFPALDNFFHIVR